MWLLRDLLLPVLWLQSWLGNGLSWRGNDMSVAGPGSSTLSEWLRRAWLGTLRAGRALSMMHGPVGVLPPAGGPGPR